MSRVVRGVEAVSPEIREGVERAVAVLGYKQHPVTRSLAPGRTDSFAVVVPQAETRVFSEDAFFATLIHGIGEEFGREGKHLVLMLAPSSESYRQVERYATDGHVDGVIIASMHGTDPLPSALVGAHIPLVARGKPLGRYRVPYVGVDDHKAVFEAVTYLLNSGRRHIVMIAGPQDMIASIDRLAGYVAAVEGAGERAVVAYGDYTRESGVQAMHEILLGGETVDAVFAASDLMAVGAMHLLQQAGIRVPEDVAVIGFDDADVARYAEPALTTVRQPIHDLGVTLARQVLRLAAGEKVEEATLLPTELIIRKSA